jgi:hypothetical protein
VKLFVLLSAAVLVLQPLGDAHAGIPGEPGKDPGCTVSYDPHLVTLEVVTPHSADFCPLLARAFGEDVLHDRVGVTPSLWHFRGAKLSCRLHLYAVPSRTITIYNSPAACRWLEGSGWARTRPATGKSAG